MSDETPDALTVTLSLAEWSHVRTYLERVWWERDRSRSIEAEIKAVVERGEAMVATKDAT